MKLIYFFIRWYYKIFAPHRIMKLIFWGDFPLGDILTDHAGNKCKWLGDNTVLLLPLKSG